MYELNTFYEKLGGYVIEINTDGIHGLVAAMQDQGASTCFVTNFLSNSANNLRDWRFPTKRELSLMYLKRLSIGGFRLKFYWSSTELTDHFAWAQNFDGGTQRYYTKTSALLVRAVRSF
jgi:hypothetical protein